MFSSKSHAGEYARNGNCRTLDSTAMDALASSLVFRCESLASISSWLRCSLVGGRGLQDTVGVDFKCDFDLRNGTARSRRNTGEFKLAEQVVSERSPSKTWIRMVGWLSVAVEKLKHVSKEHDMMDNYSHLTGIMGLRRINFMKTPAAVSIARVRGLTLMRAIMMSFVPSSPARIAPYATASSELISLEGSFPK